MISHHYKCIFVHIPKNAGQSIEHVFLDLLGLTWETRAPLLLRHNDRPELGPPKLAHLKWQEYVDCKYLTQGQFDEYYKFAFVRNPWARVVSMYTYFGYHKKSTFKDFVTKDFQNRIWSEKNWFVGPQSDFICNAQGRLMVDFVGRFESLQDDFNQVCERIGLSQIKIPHINSSQRRTDGKGSSGSLIPWRRKPVFPTFSRFQEYYDDESRELVAKLYEKDTDRFGYKFDETL